jgi:uncharacterized membrane protein
MKIANSRYLLLTLFIFGTIYALISLVNHYYFRTFALDLGLYTHALFDYSHLRMPDSSMFKSFSEPLLADHFDLYLMLFSPLSYIFGTYTLLIIQIGAILFGALGIYRFLELKTRGHSFIPLAAVISFLSFFGVLSAVAYDYHSNAVAAMLVPWFFYFLEKRKYIHSLILFLLILIAKENMALWMLFICLGLMIDNRKDKLSLAWLSAFSLVSVLYFIIIVQLVMPALSFSGEYHGFTYSVIGDTPLEALKNIILHPLDAFRTLFINHTINPGGDFVKTEFHILVLVSGFYLLLLKPSWLVMLIPLYFQKMYHDNIQMWSFAGQYAIEFAPVLVIGVFSAIAAFQHKKVQWILAAIVFTGIALSTLRVMDRTVFYTHKSMIRFYQEIHYRKNYEVGPVHRQLQLLPKDAAISSQSPFVPHLALRENIYQFPILKDAEFIVFSMKEGTYPLNESAFMEKIAEIEASGLWEDHFRNDDLVILKRKTEDCE